MDSNYKKVHFGIYGTAQKDGKLLMIKKSRGPYIGLLDLPGGRMEEGELVEETLIREIQEETAATVKNMQFFDFAEYRCVYEENGETKYFHHIGLYFLVDIDVETLREEADGHDSNGAEWILLPLHENMIAPILKKPLGKLKLILSNE